MSPHSDLSTDGFAVRLALFYAASFVAVGISMPFFPIWLEAKGLDARTIGFVLALPMVVRIFAVPIAVRVADRRAVLREALMVASIGTAAGYTLLGFADSRGLIFVLVALASVFYVPTWPLVDAYALRGLGLRRRAYGPVRLWGSVTFIAANLGAGLILDRIAPQSLIWLIAGAMIATAGVALGLVPMGSDGAPAGPAPRSRILLRNPAFLAVIAVASLLQASHAVYYGFSTIDWKAAGLDGLTIGALWALGVVAEIVLFAFSGRLPLGSAQMLALGAAGAVIRWSAMACSPPAWALPFLQVLHGLSYGATHLGTIGLLARLAPHQLGATAQGYYATLFGVVMAGIMSLSGVLYQSYGALAYAAMAVASLIAAAIIAAFWPRWQEVTQGTTTPAHTGEAGPEVP
jgi:PPP family 3-phenylpropionic acid transporter